MGGRLVSQVKSPEQETDHIQRLEGGVKTSDLPKSIAMLIHDSSQIPSTVWETILKGVVELLQQLRWSCVSKGVDMNVFFLRQDQEQNNSKVSF